MKYFISTIFIIALPLICMAQQTIYDSIAHDGLMREYILYVPASYSGSEFVPLLFNFHGAGGTADDQMEWGDFRSIADTAGFLIVHPQGTGPGIWNIGAGQADDIGFVEAMIDSIAAEYTINLDRVYATGKSLGGFFSIHLAGQLSEKIAAVASVSGTMTQGTYDASAPTRPTPVMQIHGTDDSLVPYDGNPFYLSVDEVLDYWISYNNGNTNPIVTQLPDIDTTDGTTVERYVYNNGDNGVTVEHLKVIGGGHSWPGSNDPYPGTNFDIDGSEEIWIFLSKYDINGLIGGAVGVESIYNNSKSQSFTLFQNYPNPFKSQTTIGFALKKSEYVTLKIYDHTGQLIQTLVDNQVDSGEHAITWNGKDMNGKMLSPGIYFLNMIDGAGNFGTVKLLLLE